MSSLTEVASGQMCVRCQRYLESVVCCHYTGYRRLDYGGGFGIKVADLIAAHMCDICHLEMDRLSRDKDKQIEHSEEFLHLCVLTILRLAQQGVIVVGGEAPKPSKIFRRRA